VSTARDRVLGRIRERMASALPPSAFESHVPHRTPLAAAPDLRGPDLEPAERFAAELTALGGEVHPVLDEASAIARVVALCRQHDASLVLSWHEDQIGLPGLTRALREAGIGCDAGDLPAEAAARHGRLQALGEIRVGITGAFGGIATSGTVAVISGPGRSRLASLLPPTHIAVLRASQLHPSLDALLASIGTATDRGSNLVLITGPSCTGDIEMTLTRGVHGPGEVHLVLIGSSPTTNS